MLPTEFGSIVVAVVAAGGAWASQRAAARASRVNTQVSGRLDAEKEAYERARKFDLETIERQAEEIKELRQHIDSCQKQIRDLTDRFPISLQGLEGLLREREEHGDPGDKKQ